MRPRRLAEVLTVVPRERDVDMRFQLVCLLLDSHQCGSVCHGREANERRRSTAALSDRKPGEKNPVYADVVSLQTDVEFLDVERLGFPHLSEFV